MCTSHLQDPPPEINRSSKSIPKTHQDSSHHVRRRSPLPNSSAPFCNHNKPGKPKRNQHRSQANRAGSDGIRDLAISLLCWLLSPPLSPRPPLLLLPRRSGWTPAMLLTAVPEHFTRRVPSLTPPSSRSAHHPQLPTSSPQL